MTVRLFWGFSGLASLFSETVYCSTLSGSELHLKPADKIANFLRSVVGCDGKNQTKRSVEARTRVGRQ